MMLMIRCFNNKPVLTNLEERFLLINILIIECFPMERKAPSNYLALRLLRHHSPIKPVIVEITISLRTVSARPTSTLIFKLVETQHKTMVPNNIPTFRIS